MWLLAVDIFDGSFFCPSHATPILFVQLHEGRPLISPIDSEDTVSFKFGGEGIFDQVILADMSWFLNRLGIFTCHFCSTTWFRLINYLLSWMYGPMIEGCLDYMTNKKSGD